MGLDTKINVLDHLLGELEIILGYGGHNFGSHIGFQHNQIRYEAESTPNGFLDPENIGLDTKINVLAHFLGELLMILGYGGHLGRHLEFHPSCPGSTMSTQVFFTPLGVYYQDQESKLGDICLHTGPPSAPGL